MTTFPPSPAQGETAGVSETRLKELAYVDDTCPTTAELLAVIDILIDNHAHYATSYDYIYQAYRVKLVAIRQIVGGDEAARQQIKTLADKLLDADNCQSADHAAAMAYFGQAMEHDQWRIERDVARQQLAELHDKDYALSEAEAALVMARHQLAEHQQYRRLMDDNARRLHLELFEAQQQLAEMRGAIAVLRTYIKYPLSINRDYYAEEKYDKALAVVDAALAPTSQPSRGKCERCGGSGWNPMGASQCPTCPACKGTGDCAQPERQGATPFDQLKAAMQADDAYAWSWHCNIAMPMLDAKQGLTHQQANECAAAVMEHMFRIDVRKSREWQATFQQPDAERPSPPIGRGA